MKKISRIKVSQDDSPSSPREWSNIGTMYCWHGRYTLGDEQPKHDPVEVLVSLITEVLPIGSSFEEDMSSWYEAEWMNRKLDEVGKTDSKRYDELREQLDVDKRQKIQEKFEELYVRLPLYLYDHSGITMRTSSFGDRWDSGQVGFICCLKTKAEAEMGGPSFKAKGWTKAKQAAVVKSLECEVETYDQYLTGEVYGFQIQDLVYEFEIPKEEVDITDDDLPWEDGDSCWGFYGSDLKVNGMMDHIGKGKRMLKAVKEAFSDLDTWVELPQPKPTKKLQEST